MRRVFRPTRISSRTHRQSTSTTAASGNLLLDRKFNVTPRRLFGQQDWRAPAGQPPAVGKNEHPGSRHRDAKYIGQLRLGRLQLAGGSCVRLFRPTKIMYGAATSSPISGAMLARTEFDALLEAKILIERRRFTPAGQRAHSAVELTDQPQVSDWRTTLEKLVNRWPRSRQTTSVHVEQGDGRVDLLSSRTLLV
ncbi:hypothetical protein PLANPX_4219 [Lacipirellula parvula]|uniref:Uncharacterized protein n=2 Tax=Lacipirellula parvula TaxID=2650471 RepID=A0A5K7XEY0_9BACT|nr:hypothetical protein PLANPX_4219 [Lacipirellula parvula]